MPHNEPHFGRRLPVESIFDLSDQAKGEIRTWLDQNPSKAAAAAVSVRPATYVATVETTASTSFTDLATVGPSLTGLQNGQYLVMFGAAVKAGVGDEAHMGVQSNSDSVDDQSTILTLSTSLVSISGAVVVTLSSGNNSLTAKYLSVAGGTASFGRRFLIAVKFANA